MHRINAAISKSFRLHLQELVGLHGRIHRTIISMLKEEIFLVYLAHYLIWILYLVKVINYPRCLVALLLLLHVLGNCGK